MQHPTHDSFEAGISTGSAVRIPRSNGAVDEPVRQLSALNGSSYSTDDRRPLTFGGRRAARGRRGRAVCVIDPSAEDRQE